jgi:hypothetical protein
MTDQIRRHPFFSIVLPGTTEPLVCLYEERAVEGTEPHLRFDVIGEDAGAGVGVHDLSTGTIHLFLGNDVEVEVPGSLISWTGISVMVDEEGKGIRACEDDSPVGWIILYDAWFQSTPRSAWHAEMRLAAEMDFDVPENDDIDEDAAYEHMMDPERRALALAYAA